MTASIPRYVARPPHTPPRTRSDRERYRRLGSGGPGAGVSVVASVSMRPGWRLPHPGAIGKAPWGMTGGAPGRARRAGAILRAMPVATAEQYAAMLDRALAERFA